MDRRILDGITAYAVFVIHCICLKAFKNFLRFSTSILNEYAVTQTMVSNLAAIDWTEMVILVLWTVFGDHG